MEIKEILIKLKNPDIQILEGKLLEQLVEKSKESSPILLNEYKNVVNSIKNDKYNIDSIYHIILIFILAKLKVKKAIYPFVDTLKLGTDTVDTLYGDYVTEGFQNIFATFFENNRNLRRQILFKIINNESLDDFVRNSLIDSIRISYLDNDIDNKELDRFIKKLIVKEEIIYNEILLTGLVILIAEFSMSKYYNIVLDYFDKNLIDENFFKLKDFKKLYNEKKEITINHLKKIFKFKEPKINDLCFWINYFDRYDKVILTKKQKKIRENYRR